MLKIFIPNYIQKMTKEIIPIVNEKDEIIWYKERWTLKFPEDIYRISSLWLENSKWEVLIAQRSLAKENQPWIRWPATAWTNAKWETYESNIIKEAKEEIWLELKNYKIGPKQPPELYTKNRRHFCQRFIAQSDLDISQFQLEKDWVEKIQRISKDKITKRVKTKPEEFTPNANKYIELFCK
jgi:isopentenyldiphosphate isomerase